MLCSTCGRAVAGKSDIVDEDKGNLVARLRYVHHRTWVEFQKANSDRCCICTRLWDRWMEGNQTGPLTDFLITYEFSPMPQSEDNELSWIFVMQEGGMEKSWMIFSLLKDGTRAYNGTQEVKTLHTVSTLYDQHKLREMDHRITSSTGSTACLDLFAYWLFDCQENHIGCNVLQGTPLPLQVIDVETHAPSSVRLHITDSRVEYGKYVTLSHCWGKSTILKLTTKNEQVLRAGFAIKDLPKTFRQAIRLTRALSFKYLWIDSLCIKQDSTEDWRQQSALMGVIYRNCIFNIAATSSPNSEGGLFVARDPNRLKPLSLDIKWRRYLMHPICQGRYYVWDASLWEMVRGGPLNGRGWVLQERLLSPRVLHFSKIVFWECKSLLACEIVPTGNPSRISNLNDGFYKTLSRVLDDFPGADDDEKTDLVKTAHSSWLELVERYSQCGLTEDDDILVAISGIANLIEAATNDQYVAGMWKSTLLEDLLWKTRDPAAERLIPPRAPSWSWASIKGRVFYESDIKGERSAFMAEVTDIQIRTKGSRKHGQIQEGYLSVLGSALELPWHRYDLTGCVWTVKVHQHTVRVRLEIDDRPSWVNGKEGHGKLTNLVFLPILIKRDEETCLYGLVLEPIQDCGGHLTRTGTFKFELQDTDQLPLEELRLRLEADWGKKTIILV